MKSFYDISWKVDEPTYRKDEAISYSMLQKYERNGGFPAMDNLKESISTPSLVFGSMVDTLMTGSEEEFHRQYFVADFHAISDAQAKIVRQLFEENKDAESLLDIDDNIIIAVCNAAGFQQNWNPATRAKAIKEKGQEYFNMLLLAEGKTVVTRETAEQAFNAADALYSSPNTAWYFKKASPFDTDNNIERLYQLKFKWEDPSTGVPYRCMADLIIVDHEKKMIYPKDLKTTSHYEWDFYRSFKEYRYDLQARLYARGIEEAIKNDPYFHQFEVDDYEFIVVNKDSLQPMVWRLEGYTHQDGEIILTTRYNTKLRFRDPYTIGSEIYYYMNHPEVKVPMESKSVNNIVEWLKH